MTKPDDTSPAEPTTIANPATTPATTPQASTDTAPTASAEAAEGADVQLAQTSRELADARAEIEVLKAQMADKEKQNMAEQEQQVSEELQTIAAERDTLQGEVAALKLEKQLNGKVVDPEGAVALMGGGFRTDDGEVDVDAFLERYPYMRPAGAAPATAPDGGGGLVTGTSKDAEIEQVRKDLAEAQQKGNRALAAALQTKLTDLQKK